MPARTKPKPIVVQARIDRGKLILPNRALLAAAVKRWPDMAVDVEIRPFEETRRGRANRYYRGVVLKLIAEETGHAADDLHEYFKLRHNSKLVADPATGEEIKVPQSTAKLSIQAFSDYLNLVMLDGAELCGIVFPEPRKDEDWRTPEKKGRAA